MFWIVPGAILGLCLVVAVVGAWRDRRRGPGTYHGTSADHGEAWAHHGMSEMSRHHGGGGL